LTLIDGLIVTLIVCIGATLQGSIGFGIALAANPLLVLINPAYVPGPMLASSFFLSILMLVRERKSISLVGLEWAVAGRLLGAILSAGLLLVIDAEGFVIIFGILILFAVILTVSGLEISMTKRNLAIAGTLAGIMGTIASIGGPPMALVYQRENGSRIRTTLAGFFIAGTIISMLTLTLIGRFGYQEIHLAMSMIPGIVIGFFLSTKALPWFEGKYIRPIILVVATISAIVVIIKQVV
jgi:uncharacterized protein